MKRVCLVFVLLLATSGIVSAQSTARKQKIPYIKFVQCYKCKELVISVPNPKYPAYVGSGPHLYNGRVGVQILIDENGNVATARGISGHPYFRSMLEREALNAKFKPKIVDGKPLKNTVVIFYEIVSRKRRQ